ncbi:hypothetical protein quinque_004405 [Culex quinquefasciatus]
MQYMPGPVGDQGSTRQHPRPSKYEQSDGQKREEAGVLKPVEGAEAPAISVTGSYEFTDPTGQRYRVDYTADERGYRPTVTKL